MDKSNHSNYRVYGLYVLVTWGKDKNPVGIPAYSLLVVSNKRLMMFVNETDLLALSQEQ